MTRTAILIDECDKRLGRTQVPESAQVIRHQNAVFVRTQEAIRLTRSGTGMAAVFRIAEIFTRPTLEPL